MFYKSVNSRDVERYGECLTDEDFYDTCGNNSAWYRIRTYLFENRIYYHKMVNGKVIEFKELN